MRNFVAAALVFLFLPCLLLQPAVAAGFMDELGESIANMYAALTTHRLILYSLCAGYYAKFGKWPSGKEDFEAVFQDDGKTGKEKVKAEEALGYMNLSFTPMGDNKVLIEGGYEEKMEKTLEEAGVGKCRISVIAERTRDGFVFNPSEKAKGNRDYFNLPMNMKDKAPGEPGPE